MDWLIEVNFDSDRFMSLETVLMCGSFHGTEAP